MDFIDLKTQYLKYKEEIDQAIAEVLDSGQFIMGKTVSTMEDSLAEVVGVKHCIGVSSGTDSLLLALMALGVTSGDEVITVPFTWISTAEVIELLGAKTVFIDIEPETYNLDINQLESAITSKTKAIIPVSLFGQMPNYEQINAIAARHGIPVIEDGAQSLGATQFGGNSCGVTTIGSTSFFPTKPLGCYGDGGALFTNDDELANMMRALRNHGAHRRHEHPYIGINGRLDAMQAAIIQAKLPHFNHEIHLREKVGQRYSELLEGVCDTPKVMEGNTHVYAQYTIRVNQRDEVQQKLKEKNIPTAIYYPKCIHEQPPFAKYGYKRGDFPVCEKAADEVLSLPMHPWLTEEEQQTVVEGVKEAVAIGV